MDVYKKQFKEYEQLKLDKLTNELQTYLIQMGNEHDLSLIDKIKILSRVIHYTSEHLKNDK